jgi:protocatechuate 3,4-dioxygenase beta subunit
MWTRRRFVTHLTLAAGVLSAGAGKTQQARPDLYVCEDCEGISDGIGDPATLPDTTRIAPENEPGEPLVLRGRVFAPDGVTPVPDVIVYAHHTNIEGVYADGAGETTWGRRHGRLRAWVKTGADGAYEFNTIKPGQYPNRSQPAHIHQHVLEPGRRPYWLDSVVFEGDDGVDEAYAANAENRGGSGIVRLGRLPTGEWLAERDIILESHPG